ncbi:MAG: hypothetical protein KY455_01975 [Euryarchaeota archaeon]|nr:hypothetical protein [Euryarchaeota archaeon]
MSIKRYATLALVIGLLAIVPPAEARSVCTYEDVFVAKVTADERAYTCAQTFDAVLVEAGNAAVGSALKVCLKTSAGHTIDCRSGCSFVIFTGLSDTAYITVKQPLTGDFDATCTPVAGTITVQFGDTRDGGSF